MIDRKNFCWKNNPDVATIPVDTEYLMCNFARENPVDIGGGVMRGVRLFPGDDTPRVFTDCNLMNCEPPPGSTLVHCNTRMTSAPAVASTETITLPSSTLVVEHKSIFEYGRYDPLTEAYVDLPTPNETPVR
jgi:hypothetical protein